MNIRCNIYYFLIFSCWSNFAGLWAHRVTVYDYQGWLYWLLALFGKINVRYLAHIYRTWDCTSCCLSQLTIMSLSLLANAILMLSIYKAFPLIPGGPGECWMVILPMAFMYLWIRISRAQSKIWLVLLSYRLSLLNNFFCSCPK